jgi:hypothetical protein
LYSGLKPSLVGTAASQVKSHFFDAMWVVQNMFSQ